MITKVNSCAVWGLDGQRIEVEADVSNGHPSFNIVGLPDIAICEAKERIRTAIKNSDLAFPYEKRVTINLAPANIKKMGAAYDVPMALGILLTYLHIKVELQDCLFIGELSLQGNLRPVCGILPMVIYARKQNFKYVFLPQENASEASVITGIKIMAIANIKELLKAIMDKENWPEFGHQPIIRQSLPPLFDFADIKGQEQAKRALEIAASGMHNILLSGPPGSGKTMLAKALSSILPVLSQAEILEVTQIYSIAGLLHSEQPLILERPFRSPHHSSSAVSLIGGGKIPKPGEISLAHRGVLFLDELPEFPRLVLENLRQPLEDGTVTIARTYGTVIFPARFVLVAAQNPCPCGYLFENNKKCLCSVQQISNYKKRISGPLLDRIDLHLEVPLLSFDKLTKNSATTCSAKLRDKIQMVYARQEKRFLNSPFKYNSEMTPALVKRWCILSKECFALLKEAVEKLHLSGRSYMRILKIARTIADMEDEPHIKYEHLAESLQYRPKEE